MTRERIGALVLHAYPTATRLTRGPEMLSMLLDASETSSAAYARECGSLLIGGLRERAASMVGRRRGRHITLVTGAILVVIIAVAIVASHKPTTGVGNDRRDMRAIASRVLPRLHPGDLVFVAQPQETELASYYLPGDLRFATPFGPDDHPGSSSQFRHSRLANSNPRAVFDRLTTALAPGQHLLFIRPLAAARTTRSSRSSLLVRRHTAQLSALLASDPKLREVSSAPATVKRRCCINESALLYVEN